MRIYLIGMPGSGKTTLGKALAQLMKYRFVDLDDKIIMQEGITIPEIFSQKGEGYFRLAEQKALLATFAEESIIIATGGGTPCFFDNMEQINQHGTSLFLNLPLQQIAGRLAPHKHQKTIRPLFAGKNEAQIMESLQQMWEKRLPYYQKAHFQVLLNQTRPEIVLELLKRAGE